MADSALRSAKTLGALRASSWRSRSIRDELRENLLTKLRNGATLFPGIHGYDRTVIPAVVNALLARHDLLLLGLRGQAKTRILRALTAFLDDEIPAVDGCEINDDPYGIACARCARLAKELGDALPIRWIPRDERYREKLATPDVTIADLVGDVDPIRAANLRKDFADPEVIHFGVIPRTNRGIFAINELPDLAPRIQVGLLNILEERDLQIRGFPVRIPLDVLLVFSANPEDYTSRGNIITPLKDRIASQILTHYPGDVATSRRITDQEAWTNRDLGTEVVVPELVSDLLEQVAFVARGSDLVDQSSGVSARLPIALRELLVSNLERRAASTGEKKVYPRICDLWACLPAVTGKVEMVYEGEQAGAELVAKKLVGLAVKDLFEKKFPADPKAEARERRRGPYQDPDEDGIPMPRGPKAAEARRPQVPPAPPGPYEPVLSHFTSGATLVVSDDQPFPAYEAALGQIPGLFELAAKAFPNTSREELAFAMELCLEGLHQLGRVAREDLDSTITYAEALRFEMLRKSS